MKGGGVRGGRCEDSEQRRAAACSGVRAARRRSEGCTQRRECGVQRREGGVAAAWGQCVRRRGRGGGRGDSEQRRAAA